MIRSRPILFAVRRCRLPATRTSTKPLRRPSAAERVTSATNGPHGECRDRNLLQAVTHRRRADPVRSVYSRCSLGWPAGRPADRSPNRSALPPPSPSPIILVRFSARRFGPTRMQRRRRPLDCRQARRARASEFIQIESDVPPFATMLGRPRVIGSGRPAVASVRTVWCIPAGVRCPEGTWV